MLVDKNQQVFIVGDGSVFDSAITSLVTNGTDLQVSHILSSEPSTFLDSIELNNLPKAILINESGLLNAEYILGLISTHIISPEPTILGTRIIIVRLSVNAMDVYTHPVFVAGKMTGKSRRINVRTSGDLLEAVTSIHPDLNEV